MPMHYSDQINQIEDLIGEIEALARLLLFCTEQAGSDELERLKPIFNTTLYVALDKVEAMRQPIESIYSEGAQA